MQRFLCSILLFTFIANASAQVDQAYTGYIPGTAFFINLLLCAGIVYFVFLPRFNKWPDSQAEQYSGKPIDYISNYQYFLYFMFYISTFAVIVYCISQVENIRLIFTEPTQTTSLHPLIYALLAILPLHEFTLAFILVGLLMLVPFISKIDQRWRKSLLDWARIPTNALNLKVKMLSSINFSDFQNDQMQSVILSLDENTCHSGYWLEIADTNKQITPSSLLGRSLLNALYILSLNKLQATSRADSRDIQQIESRLLEIAGVIPGYKPYNNAETQSQYVHEINQRIDTLIEILAKNHTRRYPDQKQCYLSLEQFGFKLQYSNKKDSGIICPIICSMFAVFFSCFLIIAIFMVFFDWLEIPPPRGAENWFKLERILRWSTGSGISYLFAMLLGVFWYKGLHNKFGRRNIVAYLLAFLSATVASSIYFHISRIQQLSPPFLWLAISFGLLSIVAIECFRREYNTHADVIRQATILSIIFGLVTAFLQVMIRLSFNKFSISLTDVVVFGAFGFCRGFVIAFVLSYPFMEYNRNNQNRQVIVERSGT